jgi:hypothetical protein
MQYSQFTFTTSKPQSSPTKERLSCNGAVMSALTIRAAGCPLLDEAVAFLIGGTDASAAVLRV